MIIGTAALDKILHLPSAPLGWKAAWSGERCPAAPSWKSSQIWRRVYCSVTQLCLTLCDPMDCTIPSFPVFTMSWSSLKLMSVESMMPSNHLILCHPLLPLPSIFPRFRVFSNESALQIRWPKYWSFSFSISASNEYSGLISFRIDWFDLLAIQGTLKILHQRHSSKASVL